jgi:phosphonate transport system substrate-binding protein
MTRLQSTRTWRVLVATALLLPLAACGSDEESPPPAGGAGWPEQVVFAATPSGEARTFDDDFGPFVRAMSREVGIRVKTFQAADYAGVIEGLIAGTVDVAQLGAFSYALAVQNGAKIEPAGVRIHAKTDQAGYVIYGLVPASSTVRSFEDFRGKTICFPDPASTTTLVPLFEFDKAGMKPDKDFKRLTVPAGSAIPRTVKKGDCDVGLASEAQLENAIREKELAEGDLKVVWRTRAPGSPLVVRSDLPADLRAKIKTATNALNAETLEQKGFCTGDACLISASGDFGYVPVDTSYYQVIWDACEATRIEACGPIGG